MLIANPIYDVVFKYMMDDNRVAKLLISAIIGEEIEELEFRPTEQSAEYGGRAGNLTVLRIDFSARIKDSKGGNRLVIIEIQKAKFPTDIMRFRKYLGKQYSDPENIGGDGRALPIINIYFIGHKLDHTDAPVVKVNRTYINLISGKEITEKEEFIESLSHDSYVIQIPTLEKKRRNELECLLEVFDQKRVYSSNIHILDVNEKDIPKKYRPLLRRLIKAAAEKKVRDTMDAEDDILDELENFQRSLEEKDKALNEKDKALNEKDKALNEKDKALNKAMSALVKSGMSEKKARMTLGL